MGYGLQKGSPVQLTLGKDNYEALIERHGQWIRWRKAEKCPCTEKHSSQPDPRCPNCTGTGIYYTYQKELVVTQTLGIEDNTGILEVSEEYKDATLDMVYDYDGRKYQATKGGVYISLETAPQKGKYLYVVMIQNTVKRIERAGCENAGCGYYRVDGLRLRKAGIDGLYQTVPCDIEKIEKIIDANGNEWEAGEYGADMFTIKPPTQEAGEGEEQEEPPEIAEPLTAYGVEYVPPFLFALMSQNLSKEDEREVKGVGDAICTFPYNCDVSDSDVLTVLVGTYTKKEVVNRVNDKYDVIGAYFILDISSCIGIERDYRKGVDYIIAGTNRIQWLCDDAPAVGEAYSITYQVCPTYRVVKSIPQIRTSENQRLPKKAVVELFSAYGERRGVNRQ